MADPPKITKARERRGKSTFTFKVNDDLTVRLKRIDMTTLVLGNLIPWPLLQAAQKFETMVVEVGQTEVEKRDAVAAEAMKKLDPKELEKMLQFLRHYACVMVLEPTIVMEDDGNEDHLPVAELSGDELMAIFYATPPGEEKPTTISLESAQDFRGPEPTAADSIPQAGDDIRTEAVLVDYGDREAIGA
jgi:hypothetical protein